MTSVMSGRTPIGPLVAAMSPDTAPPAAPTQPSVLEQLVGQALPPPALPAPPQPTGLAALGLTGVSGGIADYHAVRAQTVGAPTPPPSGDRAVDIAQARTHEDIAHAVQGKPTQNGVPFVQSLGDHLAQTVDAHRNAAATTGNLDEVSKGAAAWELAKFDRHAGAMPADVQRAWSRFTQGKTADYPKLLQAISTTAQDTQDSISALGNLPPQLRLVAVRTGDNGNTYSFRYDPAADTGVNDAQRWTLQKALDNLAPSEPVEAKGGKIVPAPGAPSGIILQGGQDGARVIAPVSPDSAQTLRTLYPSGRKYGAQDLWLHRAPQTSPDLDRVTYLVTHGGSEPTQADQWPHVDPAQLPASRSGRLIALNVPEMDRRVPAPEVLDRLVQMMQEKGIAVTDHQALDPHVRVAAERADGFNRPLTPERQQQLVLAFDTPQDQRKAWTFLASHPDKVAYTLHANERVSDTAVNAYQHVWAGEDGASAVVHTNMNGDVSNPRNVPVQVEPGTVSGSVERAARLIPSSDGIGDAVFGGAVRVPDHTPDKVAARSDAPLLARVNGSPATHAVVVTQTGEGVAPAVAYGPNAAQVIQRRYPNADPASVVPITISHGQNGITTTIEGVPDWHVLSAAQRVVKTLAGPRRVDVRYTPQAAPQ